MANGKTTLGLVVGNRGFFPDHLVESGRKQVLEVLEKAEDIEAREQGMREDLAKGMSFKDAFEKWGRA